MSLEANIEAAACDLLLNVHGVPSVKLAMVTNSGWPDRWFMLPNGRSCFVEFKRPNGEESKRQEYIAKMITAFGHPRAVVDNVDDAVNFVVGCLLVAKRAPK